MCGCSPDDHLAGGDTLLLAPGDAAAHLVADHRVCNVVQALQASAETVVQLLQQLACLGKLLEVHVFIKHQGTCCQSAGLRKRKLQVLAIRDLALCVHMLTHQQAQHELCDDAAASTGVRFRLHAAYLQGGVSAMVWTLWLYGVTMDHALWTLQSHVQCVE